MKHFSLSRRKMISAGSLAGLGAVTVAMSSAMGDAPVRAGLSGPYLDVRTSRGALMAQARICANLDPAKQRFDWFEGQMMAVAPNGNVTPLTDIRGFIESAIEGADDGWSLRRRLVCTYYDRKTGRRLDEFYNPITGTVVAVSHIEGAVARDRLEPTLAMNWRECGMNFDFQDSAQIAFHSDIPMRCLAGLSITSHSGLLADLQDPALTTVSDQGTWTLITGWLPWLEMSRRASGHCVFQCRRAGGPALASEWPGALT